MNQLTIVCHTHHSSVLVTNIICIQYSLFNPNQLINHLRILNLVDDINNPEVQAWVTGSDVEESFEMADNENEENALNENETISEGDEQTLNIVVKHKDVRAEENFRLFYAKYICGLCYRFTSIF